MEPLLLITIDGPAGAGKTTVSKRLADLLGYRYIDTGALYRAVAVCARQAEIALTDDGAMDAFCRSLALAWIRDASGRQRLLADGCDVTDALRSPEISMLASAVSALPAVRDCLLEVQRAMGRNKGAVFEGRDMGTVVFPNADVKFFLTASPQVRAQRRFVELARSAGPTLAEVQRDMQRRDRNDRLREIAPLRCAADAVTIDASELTVEAVVKRMLAEIRRTAAAAGI